MFAKHGFAATDVQWIADALGISKGTIYRYFPSKEKLFLAAVERGIRLMHEAITAARAAAADKIEELRAAVVALIALTVITGVAYPLLVTGIAQAAFAAFFTCC